MPEDISCTTLGGMDMLVCPVALAAPQAAPADPWTQGSEQTATSICLVRVLKSEARGQSKK